MTAAPPTPCSPAMTSTACNRPASQTCCSRVPGVQVAQTGGRGSLPGIYIRGTKSAQSLVLVDGQRIGKLDVGRQQPATLEYRPDRARGSAARLALGDLRQRCDWRGDSDFHPARCTSTACTRACTWVLAATRPGSAASACPAAMSVPASTSAPAWMTPQGINRTHESYPSDGDHDAYRNKSLSLSLSHALSDDVEVGVNLLDDRGKSRVDNSFGRYRLRPPGKASGKSPTPTSTSAVSAVMSMPGSMSAGSRAWNSAIARIATQTSTSSVMIAASSTPIAIRSTGRTT